MSDVSTVTDRGRTSARRAVPPWSHAGAEAPSTRFGAFWLDQDSGQLYRNRQPVPITPKAYGVLYYLLEHAGKLVTKADLLDAVWPRVCVTDAAIKVVIGELRRALGDDSKAPRMIATVHSRGYRFIGEPGRKSIDSARGDGLRVPASVALSTCSAPHPPLCQPQAHRDPRRPIGREGELAALHEHLARARNGSPQFVFVSGEMGIGKTTVIKAFLDDLRDDTHLEIARGHCVASCNYPYLPIFGALMDLARGREGESIVGHLRERAPSWGDRMPGTVSPGTMTLASLHCRPEDMLLEMADFLATLTRAVPLVLVLEDLHHADQATATLVDYLATVRVAAGLLVVCSYRPCALATTHAPFRRVRGNLMAKRLGVEIALSRLGRDRIPEFISSRLGPVVISANGVDALFEKTEGNPLFMEAILDDCSEQGLLNVRDGCTLVNDDMLAYLRRIPPRIACLIEETVETLSQDERQTLEAASSVGMTFSAPALAALLRNDIPSVEECCESLVQRGLILHQVSSAAWSEQRRVARYAFVHFLMRKFLVERIPATRRARRWLAP
ncbi:MAG: AAA family ATPase [Chromatiales bacterium]